MRFDLSDLSLFLNVADSGSITKGATRAHLALASASERIRGMEDTLGVKLLARGRRGVQPTPAGQALVHHARLMLEQHERMKGELGAYARGLKGHIRLLCNTAAMTEFLPGPLAAYLAAHANVDVDLEERPSYEIVQAVAQGLADIGIVADTVDLGDLQTFPFGVDRLVVVVPRGHALAKRRQVAFRDVIDRDFVGLSAGSALQDHLGQHAARGGRALKLRVRVRSFDAVCRMVERGVGIGIVPETAARRCRRGMKIASVPLSDPWAVRHLKLCVRRLDALPVHAQQLVAHLRGN
jgi:DNA-binding transcriptional LysR family regulator